MSVSHLGFSLGFTTLLYTVCNALNFDKLSKWFYLGEVIDWAGFIAYLFFGLAFFIAFFYLFAHRWITKPLAILCIVTSAMATYFIAKYNVAIDRSMIINTIHTDPTEVSGLLSVQMITYALFLVILPIVVVVRIRIRFLPPLKHLAVSILTLVLSLTLGIGGLYANYDSIHRAGNISEKYIVYSLTPVNLIASLGSIAQRTVEGYRERNPQVVRIEGKVTQQDNLIVVLAVGESARQKSFNLYGYDRKVTNPMLSQVEDLHVLNGKAKIGTTILALEEILVKNDIKLTTITSRLGIDTACYVNFKLYGNCEEVGEIEPQTCGHNGRCYDEDVLSLLEQNLASYSSGYRFVVLHLGGGSHGPLYYKRHPPEFLVFEPQCRDADVVNQCTPEALYNSYDNTILYADFVLGKIITSLQNSGLPYVFIYISDHGESLLEEGRVFHGMPPGIRLPTEQAQVPLLVKSSVPVSIAQRDEYLQPEVFDTVLNLFSIETELHEPDKAFILKPASSQAAN